MKNLILKFTFGIALFVLILSCEKDQALINSISGEYKIVKINHMASNKETTEVASDGQFSFTKCEIQNKDAQNCDGYYQIMGKDRVTFTYLPEKKNGQEELFISISNMNVDPYLGGSFEITERDSRTLILTRYEYINGSRSYNLRITLHKDN